MSGERDFRELSKTLDELSREILDENLSLEERLGRGMKAAEIYRQIQAEFRGATFDLRKLRLQRDGSIVEESIDAHGLEEDPSR